MRGLLILLLAASAWAAPLRVGRAAVKITPPTGIPMAGYYNVRLAEGTLDDLYAKAIVLEQDSTRVALVVCDLVALEAEEVAAARAAVTKLTGIPGDHVMLSATHTHTGPLVRKRLLATIADEARQIGERYLDELPGRIAESVRLAVGSMRPARVRAGLGREESVSFNRRYYMKDGTVGWNPGKLNPNIVEPTGPIDPDLGLVSFESETGEPIATYINFALHLDTTGGLRFSADYPATLARLLGQARGSTMLTLFTIGCAGNINHIDVKTRAPQKGPAEAARIGTVLAGEAIKTYTRLEPIDPTALRVKRETVKLELARHEPGDVEWARGVIAQFGKPTPPPFLDQVKAFRVLDVEARQGRPLDAEVLVITLGNRLVWVGLPGEVFTELGMAIKKASPFPYTIVVELQAGSVGYVPNRKAYPEGAYEVVSARCARGSGEKLVDTAIRLLGAMR